MKKILNGKLYDTTKMESLVEWENNYGKSDFKWCSEELMQATNGDFVLCGEGGPMTDWAPAEGNGRGYGSGMTLLSREEVLSWLETRDIEPDDDLIKKLGLETV